MILPRGDNLAHWLLTRQISLTTPNKIEEDQVVEDPQGNESDNQTQHDRWCPWNNKHCHDGCCPWNVDELDKLSNDR